MQGEVNIDVLNGYLYGLGDTPQQVAQSLIDAGIKGKRYQAHKCPVANYVKSLLNMSVGVVASASTMSVLGEVITTPANISAFIGYFDAGTWNPDPLIAALEDRS